MIGVERHGHACGSTSFSLAVVIGPYMMAARWPPRSEPQNSHAFLPKASLMESGVDFVAVDLPNVNKLTVHILAAVAEDEAERISARAKTALAAAEMRGAPPRGGTWASAG